jgi:hypothetical protein
MSEEPDDFGTGLEETDGFALFLDVEKAAFDCFIDY